MQKITLKSH